MRISRGRMELVSERYDGIFGAPESFDGDYSLAAFLRAIVISKCDGWASGNCGSGFTITRITAENKSAAESAFGYEVSAITVVETRGDYFPDDLSVDGWNALDGKPYPVNRYLSQFTKTKVYVNTDLKRVVAFVERRASHIWSQAFTSALPRIMTWYFTAALTAEEQAFFRCISVGNKDVSEAEAVNTFVNFVNEAARSADLRTFSLHKLLDGYSDVIRKQQIQTCNERVSSLTSSIGRTRTSLTDLYRQLTEETTLLRGLELAPADSSNDLFEFFDQHKCLTIISADGSQIKFGVTDLLEYYDEDEFNTIYENKNSFLHDYEKDIVKLVHAIFSEHKGTFVTNAVFTIESLRYVDMVSHTVSTEDALPQPHIHNYGCGGGNDQYYTKYADSGEWQLAIEQAIGATKNINFGDTTVVRSMLTWLRDNQSRKCIQTADGDLVSVEEFLQIIKEK